MRTFVRSAMISGFLAVAGCAEWTPERPEAVSDAAIYAGGEDGGMWVDCSGAAEEVSCLVWDIDGGNPRRSVFAPCPATPSGLTPQFLDDTRMEGRSRFYRVRPDQDLSPGSPHQRLYDEALARWGSASVCTDPVS